MLRTIATSAAALTRSVRAMKEQDREVGIMIGVNSFLCNGGVGARRLLQDSRVLGSPRKQRFCYLGNPIVASERDERLGLGGCLLASAPASYSSPSQNLRGDTFSASFLSVEKPIFRHHFARRTDLAKRYSERWQLWVLS
jgi:hypothetical protein